MKRLKLFVMLACPALIIAGIILWFQTDLFLPLITRIKEKTIILNSVEYNFKRFNYPYGIKVGDISLEEIRVLDRELIKISYDLYNFTEVSQYLSAHPTQEHTDIQIALYITADNQRLEVINPDSDFHLDEKQTFIRYLANTGIGGISFKSQYLQPNEISSIHFVIPKVDTNKYVIETQLSI